jgi:PAS domain S-box-containing protein
MIGHLAERRWPLEAAEPRPAVRAHVLSFHVLLAAAILVPLGISLFGAWLAWNQVWRQTEAELARTADAAAEYAARLLDGHALLADRVDDLLHNRPDDLVRQQEAELHLALRRMVETRPSVLTLYAVDAEGRPLVSANLFPVPRDASIADRDFYEALRGADAPGRYLSKMHLGRFDGQLYFSVAERRGAAAPTPPEAPFRGVVLVSIRPGDVGVGLQRLASRPEDTVTLTRTDGEILARSKGFDYSSPPLPANCPLRSIAAEGRERAILHDRSPFDDTDRMVAYRRVEGWPAYAIVARPRAIVIAAWQRAVAWQVGLGAPAVLGLVGLTFLAIRRSREAVEAGGVLRQEAERRRTAEALAESETRQREALETLNLGAFITRDLDGIIRFWSAGCERLYGWTSAEAVGCRAHEVLCTRSSVPRADIEAALERDGEWIGDLRQRCRDGQEVVVTTHKVLRRGTDGRPAALFEAVTDVTKQRQAEAALIANEAQLRLFLERAPAAIAVFDTEMRYLAASRRYITDYRLEDIAEPEALIGRSHYEVFPDIPECWRETHQRVLAGESLSAEDSPFPRASGRTDWIRWEMTPWHKPDGMVGGALLFSEVVTPRREAELALAESETRLRLATEGAGLGVFEFDLDHRRARFDAHAILVLAEDFVPGSWVSFDGPEYAAYLKRIHPDDRSVREASLRSIAEGKIDRIALEFRIRRLDGGWAWVWAHATLMERDPASGRPRRVVGVLQDTTERHLMAEDLREAQKLQALGRLAGGIAHDFNNVLQAVAGGAALMERRADDIPAVRRRSRMLIEAAERGASITRRLLAFARRGELRMEAVDPAELLKSMQEILAPALGAGIEVQIEAPAGLPAMLTDKGQLETALINLATNARDAMPKGGRLVLSAMAETVGEGRLQPLAAGLLPGAYICLTVRDTGAGMEAATLARVVEPFFTTKPPGKGTGLGLPMVKGFAEQSGGAFDIRSEPGQGTIVTLWFPQAAEDSLTAASALPATANVPAARRGRAPKVLVVDDEPLVRETVAAGLDAAGYRVIAAADGAEALQLLTSGSTVAAMVTDLTMPGMDGLALIREARGRRPGLPVVLLTGYAGDTAGLDLTTTADSGHFALLRKPVTSACLAEHLAKLLEACKA